MESKPVSSTSVWPLLQFLPWVLAWIPFMVDYKLCGETNLPELLLAMVVYDSSRKHTRVAIRFSEFCFFFSEILPLCLRQDTQWSSVFYRVRNLGERSLPPVPAQCHEWKRCQKGTEPLEMKSVFTDKVIAYLRTHWWEYFPFLV